MQVPIGVFEGGVWGQVQVGDGGGLSAGNKGKGTGKSMQTFLPKLPFSKLPLIRRLFVTCGVFTRYFSWLFRGFFVAFSWPSSV